MPPHNMPLGHTDVWSFLSESKAQISLREGISLSQAKNKTPLNLSLVEKAQLGYAELNNPYLPLVSLPIHLPFPN